VKDIRHRNADQNLCYLRRVEMLPTNLSTLISLRTTPQGSVANYRAEFFCFIPRPTCELAFASTLMGAVGGVANLANELPLAGK
jgi:hypothetical protein